MPGRAASTPTFTLADGTVLTWTGTPCKSSATPSVAPSSCAWPTAPTSSSRVAPGSADAIASASVAGLRRRLGSAGRAAPPRPQPFLNPVPGWQRRAKQRSRAHYASAGSSSGTGCPRSVTLVSATACAPRPALTPARTSAPLPIGRPMYQMDAAAHRPQPVHRPAPAACCCARSTRRVRPARPDLRHRRHPELGGHRSRRHRVHRPAQRHAVRPARPGRRRQPARRALELPSARRLVVARHAGHRPRRHRLRRLQHQQRPPDAQGTLYALRAPTQRHRATSSCGRPTSAQAVRRRRRRSAPTARSTPWAARAACRRSRPTATSSGRPRPAPTLKSSPALGRDGTVYVSSMNGKLYADRAADRRSGRHGHGALDVPLRRVPRQAARPWSATRRRPAPTASAAAPRPRSGPTARSTSAPTTATSTRSRPMASSSGCSRPNARSPASGRPPRSAPTTATLYFGANKGGMYALNRQMDGSLNWQYPIVGSVYSSPALDATGTLYTGSTVGHVFAIDGADRPQDLRLRRPRPDLDRARHPPRRLPADRRSPRPSHAAGRVLMPPSQRRRSRAQGYVEFGLGLAVVALIAMIGLDQMRGAVYSTSPGNRCVERAQPPAPAVTAGPGAGDPSRIGRRFACQPSQIMTLPGYDRSVIDSNEFVKCTINVLETDDSAGHPGVSPAVSSNAGDLGDERYKR